MSALSQKMRRAREVRVPAGKHTFVIERPTPEDMGEIKRVGASQAALKRFVVGWEDVTELDLGLPGGDPHPLPFDADACSEWLADRPDLMSAVGDAVLKSYVAYREKLEQQAKN